MTIPTALRGLADRVEAGKEFGIIETAVWHCAGSRLNRTTHIRVGYLLEAEAYIEAIEILRSMLLPGWCVSVYETPDKAPDGLPRPWAAIMDRPAADERTFSACAPTEPAARLAALLRGYAAQIEAGSALAQEDQSRPECCPVCGGDCASANPPVYACPMKGTDR